MAYNGYYEFTISQIDYGYQEISDFDNETLFMNIYHYWCFSNYLLMYYIWRYTTFNRLTSNIRKKWSKDFTNVNLFIELIDRRYEPINLSTFYFNSEDYFTKMLLLKTDLDKLIKEHHLPTPPKRKRKIRKCIR